MAANQPEYCFECCNAVFRCCMQPITESAIQQQFLIIEQFLIIKLAALRAAVVQRARPEVHRVAAPGVAADRRAVQQEVLVLPVLRGLLALVAGNRAAPVQRALADRRVVPGQQRGQEVRAVRPAALVPQAVSTQARRMECQIYRQAPGLVRGGWMTNSTNRWVILMGLWALSATAYRNPVVVLRKRSASVSRAMPTR